MKILCIFALILITIGSTAYGGALSDEVVRKLQKEGTLQTWMERMNQWRAAGMDQPLPRNTADNLALSHQAQTFDSTVVLLVDFYDQPAGAANTAEAFDSLLFSIGKNPTGSMKEYYLQNSYGQYTIGGKAFGWYRRAGFNHQSFNGIDDFDDDANLTPAHLVQWVVSQADFYVDFSQFDTDHDGILNGVIIVHSGYGMEESGNPYDIWSHMSPATIPTNDGVTIMSYTIQPEKSASQMSMSAIGVFCHNWGHVLGLPDLYDTDGSSEGVGNWSLMGTGNYNGNSRRPAHLDAWSKKWLGWLNPINIIADDTDIDVPAIEYNPVAYRLAKAGDSAASEYFLIENRAPIGFDDYLPGEGLMIYHVDELVSGNNNDWHPRIFIEQADGRFDLQYSFNQGDDGDPWPGTENSVLFDSSSTPSTQLYDGTQSGVTISAISDADSIMTISASTNAVTNVPHIIVLVVGAGNNVSMTDHTPTIAWDYYCPVGNPEDSFEIAVGTNPDWTHAEMWNPEAFTGPDTFITYAGLPLIDGATYYLRLRVHNGLAWSEWYNTSFRMNSVPTLPVHQWPGVNAMVATVTPALFLLNSTDAESDPLVYDFEVYDGSEYVVASATGVAQQPDSTGWTIDNPLGEDQSYHWRARAYDGYEYSAWTAPTSFYVNASEEFPSAFLVYFPPDTDNGQVYDKPVEFWWGTSTDPDPSDSVRYRLLIAIDPGFTFMATHDSIYQTRYMVGDLDYGTHYWWKVQAIDIKGHTTTSTNTADFWTWVLGDANGDRMVNVGDAVFLVSFIFRGGPAPAVLKAGDANGDCAVNIGDAVYLVSYVFRGGPAPKVGCAG